MNRDKLKEMLKNYKLGKLSTNKVLEKLAALPYLDMETVKLDTHRSLRKGFPEVILGSNKSAADLVKILKALNGHNGVTLITKLDPDKFLKVSEYVGDLKYNEISKLAVLKQGPLKKSGKGTILILTAGTSDISVAEEAALTAEYMGNKIKRIYDVGVAGIHRLLDKVSLIQKASVIIVVAGMEGALASVVGGLTSKPVIAVPTSIGYGSSFKGLAALLGMLNTCSPGVTVVNIDNGFGAGYFASLINKKFT